MSAEEVLTLKIEAGQMRETIAALRKELDELKEKFDGAGRGADGLGDGAKKSYANMRLLGESTRAAHGSVQLLNGGVQTFDAFSRAARGGADSTRYFAMGLRETSLTLIDLLRAAKDFEELKEALDLAKQANGAEGFLDMLKGPNGMLFALTAVSTAFSVASTLMLLFGENSNSAAKKVKTLREEIESLSLLGKASVAGGEAAFGDAASSLSNIIAARRQQRFDERQSRMWDWKPEGQGFGAVTGADLPVRTDELLRRLGIMSEQDRQSLAAFFPAGSDRQTEVYWRKNNRGRDFAGNFYSDKENEAVSYKDRVAFWMGNKQLPTNAEDLDAAMSDLLQAVKARAAAEKDATEAAQEWMKAQEEAAKAAQQNALNFMNLSTDRYQAMTASSKSTHVDSGFMIDTLYGPMGKEIGPKRATTETGSNYNSWQTSQDQLRADLMLTQKEMNANKAVQEAMNAAQKDGAELSVDMAKAVRGQADAYYEAREKLAAWRAEQDAWAQGWAGMAGSLSNSLGAFFASGAEGWKNWREAGMRAIQDVSQQLWQMAVTRPLVNALYQGILGAASPGDTKPGSGSNIQLPPR